jgi:NAD(P)-dependent dehydrogenase (short-subunit alcohol dehydrogenase family)
MDLQLADKRALVTGGSRGIGKAAARALAAEGADVVVAARGEPALVAAAEEIAAGTGRRVVPVLADTGSEASVRRLVAAAADALGGVDVLVNAAATPGGQSHPPALAEVDDATFFDDVNVKVMGYLRCAREVAPLMVANGWGRIVNVSGLAARTTGSIVGSIRNVAVAALTKNLADELGRHGINVTVVHPGLTVTEATPAVLRRRAEVLGTTAEEVRRQLGARTLLGRLVTAEEVAAVIAFLASPRSVAVNGDAVACGGGSPGPIHY